MTQALAVLGVFICLVSLFAIAFPKQLRDLSNSVTISTPLRLLVFAIRILLGAIMVRVADATAFPLALKIIGILIIISGVMVLLLGNSKVQALKDWFLDRGPTTIRLGGVGGLLFGAFIIHAVA